ncbi:sensor histidine kinase [Modestobacter versicolor]|uniref:sensor histidine kinase n=1 Tax=Modestobacter versicolor TaxID=429133 RepID=UPI0034DE855A
MVLTPRRRAVIAVLVVFPFAWAWCDWALYTVRALLYYLRSGFISCGGGWPRLFNSCASFSPTLAVVELLAATALAVAVAVLLSRWVLYPVRDMAATVGRFGPNSLALRLRAGGPADETRQLADGIDTMLDRLAEGYEAQRRFAANASHELRTPLATQRALIEVSLGSALTPEQLELLSRQLLATNERNERLVDGLLTLAESDRGVLVRSALPLDGVVAAVVAEHRPAAERAGLQLHATLAPVTVVGERPLLERLVGNLLSNAVKYNEPGGSVAVTVDAAGRLTVGNTGPAVPPEQVAGLFEPFRRMTGERLEHGGGVGLGLTIVRSLAAAHGAVVEARANEGGGLAVQVRFPAATAVSAAGSR